MAIMNRRGDNRKGRYGSASEKSYYEMKEASESRKRKRKAALEATKKKVTPRKTNAELKQIASRDNKRGLTKTQTRNIDLTGTRKRDAGVKMSQSIDASVLSNKKKPTPKRRAGVGTIDGPRKPTPKRKAGVGTIDGPRKPKTQNKSILKQPQRMSTKKSTPKATTTATKRKAGVGTIDGPRKTTAKKRTILKQPQRTSTKKSTSTVLSRLVDKITSRKKKKKVSTGRNKKRSSY